MRELPNVAGDARKVGYYTGMIVRLSFFERLNIDLTTSQISLHYAAEAATSFPWNRLSDYVGRRPVLLSCLAGTTLSILLFGLSHSFLALVLRWFLSSAISTD